MRAVRWRWPDEAPPDNAPPDNVSDDKESLKQRLQALQSEMAAITKQLDELEEAAEEEGKENDPL
jgi:chaperonin cofactor prefoldin